MSGNENRFAVALLALSLLLASGCASRGDAPPPTAPPVTAAAPSPAEPSCPPCVDPASPKLRAAYEAAIEQAMYPAQSKISRDLTPLLPSNKDQAWNDDGGKVLMATWTKAKHYADPEKYRRGQPFALQRDTWFTVVPEVRQFCQALGMDGPMLDLRLEQRLGLPPGKGHDVFLEVWVEATDLFRPCPDPEISDHECMVEIRVVDRADQRPWDCTSEEQVSGRYVTVQPGHLSWMCDNWVKSYDHKNLFDNYPWTALGYTYDWGDPDDPVGASEYVAPWGSEAVFESLTPTGIYCAP